MTPFNAEALLVMLLTFYPIVGPAALARARRERPEYFSGGTLIGRHGDALELPDGRIFDLIFDVLGPSMRWQVIPAPRGDGPGAPADPFALEPGPLDPIDLSSVPPPGPAPDFAGLVATRLAALGASDTRLDTAMSTIAGHSSPLPLEQTYGRTVGGAAGALGAYLQWIADTSPVDVLHALDGQRNSIDAELWPYRDPPPLDEPVEPAVRKPGDDEEDEDPRRGRREPRLPPVPPRPPPEAPPPPPAPEEPGSGGGGGEFFGS